jgi:hypothetical protein
MIKTLMIEIREFVTWGVTQSWTDAIAPEKKGSLLNPQHIG